MARRRRVRVRIPRVKLGKRADVLRQVTRANPPVIRRPFPLPNRTQLKPPMSPPQTKPGYPAPKDPPTEAPPRNVPRGIFPGEVPIPIGGQDIQQEF